MRGVDVQGSKVVAVRNRLGLTQVGLAEVSGLDVKTIRKAEQGGRLDVETVSRLAAVLQTSLGSLLVTNENGSELQKRWREIITQWLLWFDEENIDQILTLYTDDAVLRIPGGQDVIFGGVYRGKEQIRQAHISAWNAAQHQPMRLEEMALYCSDTGVAVMGKRELIIPSGDRVFVPTIQVLTFDELLIVDHHVEFDTLEFSKFFPK